MKQGRYRNYPTPTQDLIKSAGLKWCGRCNKSKPIGEFGKKTHTTSGLSSWCVICNREYDRSNRSRTRLRKLNRWYTITYGIGYHVFLKIVKKQKGLCGICNVYMDEPHLDHCPVTGRIRGVLCHKCNVGLGHFLEDPTLLNKAAHYLGEN